MARDRKFWLTATAVAGVFVFALFVRTYWNIEAASPEGTFVLSESDAYYIHHSVERIQNEGWSHPIQDPLVNYPVGGINPNPPLWEWWLAVTGVLTAPLFAGDAANHPVACPADAQPSQGTCVSTWWMTVFSPALFGALTVLLVVLIGHEMWGWRAGLLAGFLAATSTSHIERSVLGFADHDSFVLFFIVLSFLFFIKALQRAREARWVAHWGDMTSVRSGLAAYANANRLSLAFAAMAGIALAGVGLSWKGFAYGAGIFLAYGMVQVLVNHWRQRDSTHVFAVVGIALFLGLLLSMPYYANPALGAVFDTLLPLGFIFLAWVGLGIVFTAARDLPFVLVLPAALVTGAVALMVAFLVAPSVAQTLLAPLVYFKQTKLYTTIAEAHAADFNTVVFGTGVVGFFVALVALPYLFIVNRKTWKPAWTFVAIWAVVAIFMAWSAVRFLINATPVFALLGGWGTGLIVGRLKFEAIGKNLAGLGGFSRDAIKRSINAAHVVGAVLLATMLILPNVILAVDAGMPVQYEDKLIRDELTAKGLANTDANRAETFIGQRFGAFGQGFITDYWRELFEWLQQQDTELPPAQRPGFLSWWDYGHWALSLGRHPAVADNFQNGFQFAGNFIASQNETHAVQLFIARMAERTATGKVSEAQVLQALRDAGLDEAQALEARQDLKSYNFTSHLPLAKATKALASLEASTGDRIRYFAVDVRLFPYDNPQTRTIDFGSIFYAPITLSDKNPDDFVQAVYRANVPGERKNEFTQEEWEDILKDIRKASLIQESTVSTLYKYKEPFFNSMFYRTYLGTPVGLSGIPATDCKTNAQVPPTGFEGDRLPGIALPGFCMEHFRMVYYSPQVRMLKFYPGAILEGSVLVGGEPLLGTRVVVFDDAGDELFQHSVDLLTDDFKTRFQAQHGRNLSAADFNVPHQAVDVDVTGKFRVALPFSTTGQVTVKAFKDDVEVGSRSFTVSVAQAEQGFQFPSADGLIQAVNGSITGRVFFDADRDRLFGDGDVALPGAQVTIDGSPLSAVTTDAQGVYRIANAPPGRHHVLVTIDDHEMATNLDESIVTVRPGQEATFDAPMNLAKVGLEGNVWQDQDGDGTYFPGAGEDIGEGVPSVHVKAFPDFRLDGNTAFAENVFSRFNGSLLMQATPGTYILRGEHVNSTTGEGSAFGAVLTLARGQQRLAIPEADTRLVGATVASLNLTLDKGDGNVTAASSADLLFVPTQGGLPAAEKAAVNGTLTIRLVPGTYEVHARATSDGTPYRLAQPVVLAVGTEPVVLEGTLTRA